MDSVTIITGLPCDQCGWWDNLRGERLSETVIKTVGLVDCVGCSHWKGSAPRLCIDLSVIILAEPIVIHPNGKFEEIGMSTRVGILERSPGTITDECTSCPKYREFLDRTCPNETSGSPFTTRVRCSCGHSWTADIEEITLQEFYDREGIDPEELS